MPTTLAAEPSPQLIVALCPMVKSDSVNVPDTVVELPSVIGLGAADNDVKANGVGVSTMGAGENTNPNGEIPVKPPLVPPVKFAAAVKLAVNSVTGCDASGKS